MTDQPTATQVAEPKAPAKPLIDSTRSLSSQAATLTKILEQKGQEADKDEQKPVQKQEDKVPDAPKEGEQPKDDTHIEPPEEDEPEPVKPVELPAVAKFILDRLPNLTTRIKDGDKIKTVQFKDITELPEGFELADDATRAQFSADIAAQVGRAKDALNEYKQVELQNNVRKFEEQEAKEVAADLARLQRSGVLPKFQYKEDDDRFNSDDAVKLANKIYKLFKDTNNEYMKSGKTYRITYADAADKYFAREARTKANESQKAADQPKEEKRQLTPAQKERQEIAKQTGAPSGGEPKPMRPSVRSGMTMNDINRLARMGRI
jgi:hypothetical protein